MKNQLNFNAPFCCFGNNNFIHCFSSAYVYLEGIGDKVAKNCGGKDCGACDILSLLETMTGASCNRRRYENEPSELQLTIGNFESGSSDTDFTVDFLFGFTGYEYRVLTDSALFKTSVIEAIDSGKPVLAKIKTHYHVITGYDDDKLIVADYKYSNIPNNAPEYSEIEKMFIFGKIESVRYSYIDGLKNIKQMMELNANEKIWDKYIEEIQNKIIHPTEGVTAEENADEQQKVMSELAAAGDCAYANWNIVNAVGNKSYEVLINPLSEELNKLIWRKGCESLDFGHFMHYMNRKMEWHNAPCSWQWIGKMFVMVIERYKETDAELLDLINQAIETTSITKEQIDESFCRRKMLLSMSNEQRKEYYIKEEAEKRNHENERFKPLYDAFESIPPYGNSMEIDLTTMVKKGEFDLNYSNGIMAIKTEGDQCGMLTPQEFKAPLKIELRAKTDSTNIRIKYAQGGIIFNWECNPSELRIHDIANDTGYGYKKRGEIPIEEFVNIEWILGREFMAAKVNGELRYIGDNYEYIKRFKENPEYNLSSAVTVAAAKGSTVTVEMLRITEL